MTASVAASVGDKPRQSQHRGRAIRTLAPRFIHAGTRQGVGRCAYGLPGEAFPRVRREKPPAAPGGPTVHRILGTGRKCGGAVKNAGARYASELHAFPGVLR